MLLNAAEWSRLACNVEKVDIAPDRFDEGVLYCGSAWDYVLKRSNSLTDCVTFLTRFLFAWGAFESVAHSVCLGIRKSSESVVESTKSYLCNNVSTFSNEKKTIGQFYSEIDKVEQFRLELEHYGILNLAQNCKCANLGDALFCVSKIRNHLAHGSLRLDTYEKWNGEHDCVTSNRVVIYSTRVVLSVIAKLLFSQLGEDYVLDDVLYEGIGASKTVCEYLSTLYRVVMHCSRCCVSKRHSVTSSFFSL